MSIVADLMSRPGVLAAGEYAFRGDRFSYRGALNEEHARMASIMCRATTMGVVMEGRMADNAKPGSRLARTRGWAVRCPEYTVCVVANVFCFASNAPGVVDGVLALMRKTLADTDMELV